MALCHSDPCGSQTMPTHSIIHTGEWISFNQKRSHVSILKKSSSSSTLHPPPKPKLKSSISSPNIRLAKTPKRRDSAKSLCFDSIIEKVCLFSVDDVPLKIKSSPQYCVDTVPSLEVPPSPKSSSDPAGIKPNTTYFDPWKIIKSPSPTLPTKHIHFTSISISTVGVQCWFVVQNIAFVKKPSVRYTIDGWTTFSDSIAVFQTGSGVAKGYDLFMSTFQIPNPTTTPDNVQKVDLEFALCVEMGGGVFWDNNSGCNYTVSMTRTTRQVSAPTAALLKARKGVSVEQIYTAAEQAAKKSADTVANEVLSMSAGKKSFGSCVDMADCLRKLTRSKSAFELREASNNVHEATEDESSRMNLTFHKKQMHDERKKGYPESFINQKVSQAIQGWSCWDSQSSASDDDGPFY